MRSWLKRLYEEHEYAFYFGALFFSLGGGGVAVKLIGSFASLDTGWMLSIFALVSGGLLIALQYLPATERTGTSSGVWESTLEPTNRDTMVVGLRSSKGARMTRGFACDVRGPMSGAPARAVIDKTGPTQWEHVHYPESFVPVGLRVREGRYDVTWYEADEEWRWREVAHSTYEVSFQGSDGIVAQ